MAASLPMRISTHGLLLLLVAAALAPLAVPQARAGGGEWVYAARPGDNLWNLADKHLKAGFRYTERLRRLNNIADPLHILPGTHIRFPVDWLKIQPATATLADFRGQVAVEHDGERRPAGRDVTLAAGDRVFTGADSTATIRYADGSLTYLKADTTLEFDSLSAYGETGMVDSRMRVQTGRTENDVRPQRGGGARFRISTPAAIAAVRGTDFRVSANPQGDTRSEVTEGRIDFAAAGKRVTIPKGFGTLVAKGEPPAPPVPLLPAPDLATLPPLSRDINIPFDWPALTGAAAYRIQFFLDPAHTRLLQERKVTTHRPVVAAPPDGDYWLRIRGIDENGLEGFDAKRKLTIDARPVPPSPLQPPDGMRTHDTPPKLWWSQPQGSVSYDLQVATDAKFENLILERKTTTETRFEFAQLPPPGNYFWRLAAHNEAGETGPYSPARGFRVLVVPEPVNANSPALAENEVEFSWSRAANAASYHFQLAEDEDFKRLLVDETLTPPLYKMEKLDPGDYYFRVRAISDEDVAGPFGVPNRLEIPYETDFTYLLMFILPLILLL